MASNPNCYQRGNFVCWVGSINGKKNIRECVRAFDQNAITCNSARQRFCRIHGTRACEGGIRVCADDNCPGGGSALSTDGEIFINDEGQGLDALLDDLSGRDTNFVNTQLGIGEIRASQLEAMGSEEREKGGFLSFDNKWFVPAIAIALGLGFVAIAANKDKIRRFVPRRRR